MENKISFNELNLDTKLTQTLEKNGFTHPTAIQELTITPILEGQDIFALAETGSGKTGSFAIPIINKLIQGETGTAVVLSPTRELAQQTHKFFETIGKELGIKSSSLIGGENIDKQKELLSEGSQVLVATPGRLVDLIRQKAVNLKDCRFIVFDEADRLFDMGFKKDIEFILKGCPNSRQLLMVSATTNMDVLQTAYRFHSHPLELKLNRDSILVDKIDHKIAMVTQEEKMPLLVKTLREHEDTYAIIFCNTQVQTHLVAEWLRKMDFHARPISGRLAQNRRTKLMQEFRDKVVTILVCTDVAARGLDIQDVNLVINYDMPPEAANYVHRIGRTGRAGKEGLAISFCAFEDCASLDDIYELIGAKIPKLDLDENSFATDIPSKPQIDMKTLRLKSEVQKETRMKKTQTNDKNSKQRNNKRENLPKVQATKLPKFVASEDNSDNRSFVMTTSDLKEAQSSALGYFQLLDKGILEHQVLKKGMKKFIFFGAQKVTYKFTVKNNYKKLLMPFFIEILKLSRLKLYVQVFYKNNVLDINFKGTDESLLTRNNNELLQSFEQLARTYLSNKLVLPNNLKINLNCSESKKQEKGLIAFVDKMKKQVMDSKEPVLLKPLNPAERRLVHQHLDKDKNVQTQSVGEGRFKRIEISLRDANAPL